VFDQIFGRVVASKRIPADPDTPAYLRDLCLKDGRTELRACYPADICNIIQSIGKYEGRPPRLTKNDITRAAALYFSKS
jgi:hypothetical protein